MPRATFFLRDGRFLFFYFVFSRHQTNHQVLRKMLPDHIYQYCITNHLLDNMIAVKTENIDNDVSTTFSSDSATSSITNTGTALTMKG